MVIISNLEAARGLITLGNREQPLVLDPLQLLMRDPPFLVHSAAAQGPPRVHAAKPAPLPDGERPLPENAGHLVRRVRRLRRVADRGAGDGEGAGEGGSLRQAPAASRRRAAASRGDDDGLETMGPPCRPRADARGRAVGVSVWWNEPTRPAEQDRRPVRRPPAKDP